MLASLTNPAGGFPHPTLPYLSFLQFHGLSDKINDDEQLVFLSWNC
jgi:hypothetical protein